MDGAAPRWRVARFDLSVHPVFDKTLREAGIETVKSPLPASDDDVVRALAGAHVYHASSARNETAKFSFVTPALIERNPHVLAVSTYGAGYDSVDVEACTRAGIAVMNQAGANRFSVAEHTMGLILGVTHRLAESDRLLRERRGFSREDLMGHEIGGMTLGLVGIGHVGTTVAQMAGAFRLDVIAVDPYLDAEEVATRGARKVELDELLEKSDIVSLHCPRDASTVGMIGAAQFARMRKGAWFVTTARGGIHDEEALAAALASGHLAGAGVDVWQPEPPALDNPLLKLPNVFATYHTAGVTHEARHNIARMGSEQIVHMLRGERPPRLVNPEVWPAFQRRFAAVEKR